MNQIRTTITCAVLTAWYYIRTIAFASGGDAASSLMQTVIEWTSKLIVIPGVVLAIMGIIGFAQAHSEGDGPAQQKATGKLAAAGMLVLLSILLHASAPTLTAMIAH